MGFFKKTKEASSFKMPVGRKFNNVFSSSMKRASLFKKRAVSSELPDIADAGLCSFFTYEYPDMTKHVMEAMMTPSATLGGMNSGQAIWLVPFSATNHWIKTWNTFLCAISLFEGFCTPLAAAFQEVKTDEIRVIFLLISFIMLADVILMFFQSYKSSNGLYEERMKEVAIHYFAGWFIFDASCVLIRWFIHFDSALLDDETVRVLNYKIFVRNIVVIQAFKTVFKKDHFLRILSRRGIFRVFSLMLIFLGFIHVYSIILLFLAFENEDSTFFERQPKDSEVNWFTTYTEFYLASFYILTGKPVVLTTTKEKWFGIFGSLIGLLVQAYLLGEVTLLLQKFNARNTKWRIALEELNDSMGNMKLTRALQKRVRNAFAFWWAINGSQTKETQWLQSVCPELRTEVFLQVNKQLLLKVPMFKDGDDSFLMAITERLETELYLPGGYVILLGEVGSSMYFINDGTLQALNKEETIVYALMAPGMFFGEIALLNLNTKRTATVRSFTYSQLSKLTRRNLDLALEQLPDKGVTELQGLELTAKERQENTKKVNDFRAKLEKKKGPSMKTRHSIR